MKHYLVDTNIIIDMLLNREDADAIFYSLRKILTREQRIYALTQLSEALEVSPVDYEVINNALRSGWPDFEDAVQNYAAFADPDVDGIITRNVKDFQASELEIKDSLDFLPKADIGK